MKYTYATLAIAALCSANPISQAPSTAPSSFRITNVVYGGSGCPQGSIDVDWTDQRILPIRFSPAFTAKVGSGADATDSRKNCQLNLKLAFDPGFQFTVYQADYTGWADLDSGVTGLVKSTYYFSGEKDQTSSALSLAGPYHGKYYKQDSTPIAVWSPCGSEAMLNVNSEVALTPFATYLNGVLASTKESGRFVNNLYVEWKKC